jgi:hypothetical protein
MGAGRGSLRGVIEATRLFTRISAGLFGPLSGNPASLYWTILATYYHYEFERERY